jgi:methionyl-tRNA synthetase
LVDEYIVPVVKLLGQYQFRDAQFKMMELARLGNKYLADEEPWKTIKTDPERTKTVLFVALQIAAALQAVSAPILPHTAHKLKTILNSPGIGWNDISDQPLLVPGHQLGEPVLLFRRIEDEEIQQQIDRLNATKKENQPEIKKNIMPQKPACTFDTFSAIDLRVGTIVAAEKMPKADKLLVLQVQTGLDIRTIVSGIAEHFAPESLIGQRVTVLLNLEPRPLRGVISEGMLLLTQDELGKLVFVNPDKPGVSDGAVIS